MKFALTYMMIAHIVRPIIIIIIIIIIISPIWSLQYN